MLSALLVLSACGRKPIRSAPAPAPPVVRAPAPVPSPPTAETRPPELTPPPAVEPELPDEIPAVRDPNARWSAKTEKLHTGDIVRYQIHPPLFRKPAETYPIVIVLHGANGRGTDNRKQIEAPYRNATHYWLDEDRQRDYPCFVIAPQAPNIPRATWVRQWGLVPRRKGQSLEPLEAVLTLVTQLAEDEPIDLSRQYLVGQSMGAFAVWLAVTRHPERFAAGIPIAGGGSPAMVTPQVAAAIWAFHGKLDRVVPVRRSREMRDAFKKAGLPIRYTEYPRGKHDVWDQVFEEPGLAEWLFSHRVASPLEQPN